MRSVPVVAGPPAMEKFMAGGRQQRHILIRKVASITIPVRGVFHEGASCPVEYWWPLLPQTTHHIDTLFRMGWAYAGSPRSRFAPATCFICKHQARSPWVVWYCDTITDLPGQHGGIHMP